MPPRQTQPNALPPRLAWQQRDSLALGLVCGAALLLRVLYLLCLQSTVFFDHLLINAAQYEGWARHGYPPGEPFYQSPLYVTWLRAVFVLTSETSQLLIARLWQILFGTLSCALVFVAARLLAGRLAGVLAGLLTALASALIYFDLEILPTSLATLLLTATVTGHIVASVGFPGKRQLVWLATALTLGLAIVVRPNFLIFLPLFAGHTLWQCKQVAGNRWLRTLVFYSLIAILPMIVVSAHNTASGQGFVLLTTSVGDNLLLAHNPQADGLNPFPPSAITNVLQEYDRLGMNMVQRSAAARQLAMQWLRNHPAQAAALWGKKLLLFYNRTEIPNNRSIRQQVQACTLLRVPPAGWVGLALLLPLALAGLVALRQTPLRTLLLSLLVAAPVSLMPFLVCARFRTPLIPTLALLAGVSIATLVRGIPRRRAGGMLLAMIVGALIAWPGYYGVHSTEFPRLATNRARLYRTLADQQRATGNTAAADSLLRNVLRTLEQAVHEHPQDATAHLWLADMRRDQKKEQEAMQLYQRALSLDANLVQAHIALADMARQQRQSASAIEHLQAALQLRRQDTTLTVDLAELLVRVGRRRDAVALLLQQLQVPTLSAYDREGLQRLLQKIGGP